MVCSEAVTKPPLRWLKISSVGHGIVIQATSICGREPGSNIIVSLSSTVLKTKFSPTE